MVEQASRCFTLVWMSLVNCAKMAVRPPIIKSTSMVREATITVAKTVNTMPEPFTNPACIKAEAGVGAVIEDNNHL